MGVDLLTVVRAEQEAEQLVKQAEQRRQQAIAKALADREAKLANLTTPEIKVPALKPLKANLDSIISAAKKNRAKAVKQILEELHET